MTNAITSRAGRDDAPRFLCPGCGGFRQCAGRCRILLTQIRAHATPSLIQGIFLGARQGYEDRCSGLCCEDCGRCQTCGQDRRAAA